MVATSAPRRHIVGRPTRSRKFGVVVAGALLLSSIAFFLLHNIFHLIEAVTGFYLVVAAGTLLACYAGYQSSGILLSWAMTLGAVSGAVLQYWSYRAQATFGAVPLEPPYFVYGFNAVEFWIPVGFLLGTVAYGIGVPFAGRLTSR